MKDRYDLIIFDWDGTLIDSIDWIVQCIQHAAQDCQCPIPEPQAAKDLIGLSLQGLMENLYPDCDDVGISRLMHSYLKQYKAWEVSQNDLFEGVFNTLIELRQHGFQLAIATGKTRKGLDSAMQASGVMGLFDSSRCADETASKPNPLMLTELLEHTQVSHQRCLMVGDSIHDLNMAEQAGIDRIAVSCGVHSEKTLANYAPLHCLQQTSEILNLI